MQKFLARPVTAPLLFFFGILFSQFGYTCLRRGFFRFTSQSGLVQIISPSSNPTFYWALIGGMLALASGCLAFSAYAAFCFLRVLRADGARRFRPRPFGILMFALGLVVMIVALLAGTCSHR